MITRRRIITSAAIAALAPSRLHADVASVPDTSPFQHGVASGDPLADRVILWTRITAATGAPVPVRWSIAEDEAFRRIVDGGEATALPWRDHTVKVDAAGLEPARSYFYRFEALGHQSPMGRTRTLPMTGTTRARLAIASCANLPFGYFNAYGRIAARDDLDAVLHLGDYLYEYAPGEYGDGTALGRVHLPARELIALADYRMRHAQYKTDPDLQEAHRRHPWICVWDDHEIANNSWRDGSRNHNPERGEGSWQDRKAAAQRAHHEWLPIREQHSARGFYSYRSFAFGDLADLIMLDTRLHGRSAQLVDGNDRAGLADPTRTLLGADQHAWLAEELRASKRRGAPWHVIGQQCMFAQLLDQAGRIPNPDQWDGYPYSRKAVLDQLASERIDDTVIVSGDIHSAWAVDVAMDPFSADYDCSDGRGSIAVELITTSVTSPGPFGVGADAIEREQVILGQLPHVQWLDSRDRGYLLLDLDAERARAEWWVVDTITERSEREHLAAAFATARGRNHLVRSS